MNSRADFYVFRIRYPILSLDHSIISNDQVFYHSLKKNSRQSQIRLFNFGLVWKETYRKSFRLKLWLIKVNLKHTKGHTCYAPFVLLLYK